MYVLRIIVTFNRYTFSRETSTSYRQYVTGMIIYGNDIFSCHLDDNLSIILDKEPPNLHRYN